MKEGRRGPLDRYLSILELIAASQRGLRLIEIADMIGLPGPTVHRLVGVLGQAGALESDGQRPRAFRIGPRVRRILMLGQDERLVHNYAQIVCDDLAQRLRETCYVVRLGHDAAHTVTKSVPDQGHRLHVFPGVELPAHAAASVKAILAYQPMQVRRRVLREPLPRLTSRTRTGMSEVMKELDRVARRGFAVCDREIDPQVTAYACPVFLAGAGVLYSVGVTGPCGRLTMQPARYWEEALRDAAARFAAMLGPPACGARAPECLPGRAAAGAERSAALDRRAARSRWQTRAATGWPTADED